MNLGPQHLQQALRALVCGNGHQVTPETNRLHPNGHTLVCRVCATDSRKRLADATRRVKPEQLRLPGFLPAEPLLRLVERRALEYGSTDLLFAAKGLNERAIWRMRASGRIGLRKADEWATRLGVWPGDLWPEYLEATA